MLDWQRRRILIWGKTRPELSKTYREVVCTGGVLADTRRLVRLYPVPLRYMDDERVFKKYQWIEAFVARDPRDPRPESYKIRADGIELGEVIKTKRGGNWDDRADWVMQPENIYNSVEALQQRQREDGTSLGLIRPAKILRIRAEPISATERSQAWTRYQEAISQLDLPLDVTTGRVIRPVGASEYRFKAQFRCDDPRCTTGHEFGILDWEMDALYFNLKLNKGDPPPVAAKKVVDKLIERCSPDYDTHFFLGNIRTHLHVFTIVGLWSPKKRPNA